MLKEYLGLSDVIIERTAYMYSKAKEKGILSGRPIQLLWQPLYLLHAEKLRVPPTLEDIATLSNVIRKYIAKSQRSDD
jgi:transcription initiation factor TFIIB